VKPSDPDHHPQPHQHAPQPDSDPHRRRSERVNNNAAADPAVSILKASDPKTLGNAIGAAGHRRQPTP
jgi:hypothetical protein